jgi:hypothetical protein
MCLSNSSFVHNQEKLVRWATTWWNFLEKHVPVKFNFCQQMYPTRKNLLDGQQHDGISWKTLLKWPTTLFAHVPVHFNLCQQLYPTRENLSYGQHHNGFSLKQLTTTSTSIFITAVPNCEPYAPDRLAFKSSLSFVRDGPAPPSHAYCHSA